MLGTSADDQVASIRTVRQSIREQLTINSNSHQNIPDLQRNSFLNNLPIHPGQQNLPNLRHQMQSVLRF